jgi:phosphoribosylaminoimidazolecarboxamide formyltransferase/IMP cyclohydrolase
VKPTDETKTMTMNAKDVPMGEAMSEAKRIQSREAKRLQWPRAALLSLSDKTGAAEFAAMLARGGTRILASGGTAAHLKSAGLEVTLVEDQTGVSEMLAGRVKTLHPHVHAPILARRGSAEDMAELERRGLLPLDLVAVTLYPFEERGVGLDDAGMIEEIDIGGVALLRAAAKNHDGVIVIHDPSQYAQVAEALARGVTAADRRRWAQAAFARTARYDTCIAGELARRSDEPDAPPATRVFVLERTRTLRYGENPHQVAAVYAPRGEAGLAVSREVKELSYNNLLDLEAAVRLVGRFDRPACVIVKHLEPCGVAVAATLAQAYERANAADPLSAFGGIVAVNQPLDAATATAIAGRFVECVAFPDLLPGAELAFAAKKNVRLVRLSAADVQPPDAWQWRAVGPWVLAQRETGAAPPPWRTVTKRAPDDAEQRALAFAWEVVAAARSNAIVLARGTSHTGTVFASLMEADFASLMGAGFASLIGLGSGQTSRVDAVDVALMKARRAGHDLAGAVLASDGFFPFADGVTHAAEAGVRAIVQPGGSVRDAEVIAEADRLEVAMQFTDRRMFRH